MSKAAPQAAIKPAPKPPAVAPEDAPLADVAPEDAPIPDVAPGEAPPPAAPGKPGAPPSDAASAITGNAASIGSAVTSATPQAKSTLAPPSRPGAPIRQVPSMSGMNAASSAAPDRAAEADAPVEGAPQWWDIASSFQPDFMRQALLMGLLVAFGCAYLGVYVVLKRIVFVGVALAQISSAGVALGLLLGFSPVWGAFGFVILGVALFSIRWSPRRVPHESYIGILYAVAGAVGVLLISQQAQGEGQMLNLLQGDIIAASGEPGLLAQMLVVFGALALLHALFHKEFVLVSFDRESASTLGYRAAWWDFLLFLTIGLAISMAIRAVGTLLVSALLILPASTALLLVNRLKWAFLLAPLLTIVPIVLGLHWSLHSASAPPSAISVALSFVLFLPALAWHSFKRRG